MKVLCSFAIVFCLAWNGRAQETQQFAVTVTATNDPSTVVGGGTVWLTGNRMVFAFSSPAYFSYVAIHGPAALGTEGPQIFPLPWFCAADGDCGDGEEFYLTSEQVTQLRGGLWYLLLGNNRGQIASPRTCAFQATNDVNFDAIIIGRNPTNGGLPRFVRFGRASFGLTGDVLSYEVRMPAAYGPYNFAFVDRLGGPRNWYVEASVGSVECVAETVPNQPPDPQGLEGLPACMVRGAICIREAAIPQLLAGEWVVWITSSNSRLELVPIIPLDSDQDGIPDFHDSCADTAPGSVVNTNGCSIEQLAPCAGPWLNHGEYVNRVKAVSAGFVKAGLITEAQRRVLLNQAAQSGCGSR